MKQRCGNDSIDVSVRKWVKKFRCRKKDQISGCCIVDLLSKMGFGQIECHTKTEIPLTKENTSHTCDQPINYFKNLLLHPSASGTINC